MGEALSGATDDWWIIGSAAVALHGARPAAIADVDVLTTPDQARRLAEQWRVAPTPAKPHPLFRSEVYFQQTELPVAVDVMAGFQVNGPDGWRPVWPRSRVAVAYAGAALFVPSRAELIAILELFGRPKDHERAALLRSLPA
ncbi:hypothetical protein DJ021_01315 [Phenylobacterium hankyongense]|uniref:Nucleotidyltransferase family protein n=1 Tax=Phenylobacterium hankyongense TaxID=1813876 RepID=A0A328AWI3_9CAUL|nr:hypothetical protein DJ021_01315 [Phenylobacterium hankyongense]